MHVAFKAGLRLDVLTLKNVALRTLAAGDRGDMVRPPWPKTWKAEGVVGIHLRPKGDVGAAERFRLSVGDSAGNVHGNSAHPATPMALGGGTSIFNLYVNSGTAPTSVAIGLSTNQTVPPSPMPRVEDGWAGNFNGNEWGTYIFPPATAGTWYAWAIGYSGANGTGSVLFAIVGAPVTAS